MNAKLRSQMYPAISYNSRARCEKRWEDAANIYDDISDEWQISIGNGKRLDRKWRKAGGLYYVLDNNGCERCIYNENYDVSLDEAKYDYTQRLQEQRQHDREIAYIRGGGSTFRQYGNY